MPARGCNCRSQITQYLPKAGRVRYSPFYRCIPHLNRAACRVMTAFSRKGDLFVDDGYRTRGFDFSLIAERSARRRVASIDMRNHKMGTLRHAVLGHDVLRGLGKSPHRQVQTKNPRSKGEWSTDI